MSWLSDSTELISGGWLSSAYAGHGVRGDAVPATGTHGAPPLYASLSLPADAANEYRWGIVTPPTVGTLVVGEDGAEDYTPPPGTTDLTVTYVWRLWENGVDLGTATRTIIFGAGSPTPTFNPAWVGPRTSYG